MKENKKNIILTILMIILIILIIVSTTLFIMYKNNDSNKDEINSDKIMNYWVLYKQEIIQNNEIIDVVDKDDVDDIKLNIKNKLIETCYTESEEEKCDKTAYTYSDNTLVILEGSDYMSGTYKVTFEDNTMILETKENKENNVKIKNYFQKAEG